LSLWEFLAAVEGYIKANTPEDNQDKKLSDAEADALANWDKI
jgi:hypothetical protein